MKRTDDPDIQGSRFFQDRLHLYAVLADDAEVIPAGFAGPAFLILRVQRAELAESVRAEEDLVGTVVGHHHLGPVDHGGGDECQNMGAKIQRVVFFHGDRAVGIVNTGEILHHGKGFGRRHDLCFRICLCKGFDPGGMVRFHVVHDQIIGFASGQGSIEICQPFRYEMAVSGVHDSDPVVQDHIGIVSHAFRNSIHTFEEIDVVIVHADVSDIVCDVAHVVCLLPEFLSENVFYHNR